MAFRESSSSERSSSPNPLLDALITGLSRRPEGEGEGEDSESEEPEEPSEYSPGKEQAMIDSLYPVLEIPHGSPELGRPTTPVLECKTTVELCAKEPGEETASDDSFVYDPRVSASPQRRRTEIPETPPESSDSGSEEEADDDDGWNSTSSDSTEDPIVVNGRRRFRPDWYHPHTKKALQFFNRPGKWPDLVDEYEVWARETLTALQLAYLRGFALGTLDQHRGSKYWREGDRKAFGIIAHCMERGVHGLKCAADETAFDKAVPRWDLREWAVAGRKALESKGKDPTLIRTMSGRLPRVEMTAIELWEALKHHSNDPSSVGRVDGGDLTESISPRTVLPTPASPALVPHTGFAVSSALMTGSISGTQSTAPGPVSAPFPPANGNETNAPTPEVTGALPPTSPSTETPAPGPIFFPSSSAPGTSTFPTVNVPSVKNFAALTPDPVELYQQWQRFFSSNVLDNGGNVKSFSESLDIQAADLAIYGDRFAIPQWVKKMQFLDGLPKNFSKAKADFLRLRGERLLLDDPEYNYTGRLTDGNTQAVTWKALVGHFDVKEMELENERLKAAEEETNRRDFEREERFAQEQAAKQLKQEACRREEHETQEREDECMRTANRPQPQENQGTLDSSASTAAAAASQAPLQRKEKVPSPPNEPNAPLRTPFYQFASNRKRADPRKNALPARSALKPSPPTATLATASLSSSSSTSRRSKLRKAQKAKLGKCTSPAQFSKAAQDARKRRMSSGSSSKADEVERPTSSNKANEDERPGSSGDGAMDVDVNVPSTPVNKYTWSFKPGPPITSSGNPAKAGAGSNTVDSKPAQSNDSRNETTEQGPFSDATGNSAISPPSGASGVNTKPARSNDSGNGSPMSGIDSNAVQPDPLSAPSGTNSRPNGNASESGGSDGPGNVTDEAANDKTIVDPPVTTESRPVKTAANVKSARTPSPTKPQPLRNSGDQANQPNTARKTIIDPARIDVDPRTLPAYCNVCKMIGHAGNTKRCPRYTPSAGRIVGNESHRGPVPGKSEQERLLREREEIAEREKKKKAKEERKAERAARKEKERAERERLEQEKVEQELTKKEQREEETLGEEMNAEDGTVKSATTASTAEGERKKKKKSKGKKAEPEQSHTQDPHVVLEPQVKIEPALPRASERPAASAAAGSSTSAGTKRSIEEVGEAAPVDKAERKRRKKEKRMRKREEERQAKLRQQDVQAAE